MKKWLLFACTMCLVVVLAACGTNTAKEDNKPTNTAADSGATSSDLVMTASNWKFDQKEYRIKAGETVNIKLDSVDGIHGVQIKKTDYKMGNNETIEVNISEPGNYEMICSVPCGAGHTKMKAILVVE